MTSKKKEPSIDGKKISLNFIDVDIKLCKPDFNNDSMTDCYGQYWRRKNLIEIQSGLKPLDEVNTVIHEILHLIAYASGEVTAGALKEENDEERLVTNFANLLIILLRQNDWVLGYLKKKLTDSDHHT